MSEPLLTPNPKRFSLFPIRHGDLWSLYKEAESSFWQAEEITLDKDVEDWAHLPADVRDWITSVLGWFQVADGIVNENLITNFAKEVQAPEARCFFGMQIAVENVHQETYAVLVDTLITDALQKEQLFDAISNYPSLKAKADWCNEYTDSNIPFARRLVAWACTEMLFFSTSFAAIFFVKAHHRTMPGLCFSNELISRDEGLHCKFACVLFRQLKHPPAIDDVHNIIRSAVDAEKTFVIDSCCARMQDAMLTYVEYVGDILCSMLGIPLLYHTPLHAKLEYMRMIDMPGKTNYFEKRNSAYSVKPPEKMSGFVPGDDF